MLVIGRKENEEIYINGPCKIMVSRITGVDVKLGIEAMPGTRALRKELVVAAQGREFFCTDCNEYVCSEDVLLQNQQTPQCRKCFAKLMPTLVEMLETTEGGAA